MKTLSKTLLLLLGSQLSHSIAVHQKEERNLQECFFDLDVINQLEDAVEDISVEREYILCPGQNYTIGTINDDGVVVGGFAPLRPRSNAIIQCGQNISSDESCELIGGDYAIFSMVPIMEDMRNVKFQGLTFSEQELGAIVVGRPGDMTFTDCVISNQQNNGPVQLLYTSESGRRMIENVENAIGISGMLYVGELIDHVEKPATQHRELQGSANLKVTFERVVFEENTFLRNESNTFPGIVSAISKDVELIFQDVVFRNNDYGEGNEANFTYAISTFGPLTIENSCFEENTFLDVAPVMAIGADAIVNAENNSGTPGNETECDFIVSFPTEDDQDFNVTCTSFDSSTCSAQLELVSKAPTMSPSEAPSIATSEAPSITPQCSFFGNACEEDGDCCEQRCLFNECQRPRPVVDTRTRLSGELRGGAAGADGGLKNTIRGAIIGFGGRRLDHRQIRGN